MNINNANIAGNLPDMNLFHITSLTAYNEKKSTTA